MFQKNISRERKNIGRDYLCFKHYSFVFLLKKNYLYIWIPDTVLLFLIKKTCFFLKKQSSSNRNIKTEHKQPKGPLHDWYMSIPDLSWVWIELKPIWSWDRGIVGTKTRFVICGAHLGVIQIADIIWSALTITKQNLT